MSNERVVELQENGYCVLRRCLPRDAVDACREAALPAMLKHIGGGGRQANRGPYRHFLPMRFDRPCFASEFFFDAQVLDVIRGAMGPRIVADQWGCDIPLRGSDYQQFHVDYQRPLFEEVPHLSLPAYMLVVSFGLITITAEHGPMEIAIGTHRLAREEAIQAIESGGSNVHRVLLDIGDVLIRHPWALHRGTPNLTDTPRALASIRYVRRWYADDSREVDTIPYVVWQSLSDEQKALMRFPIRDDLPRACRPA